MYDWHFRDALKLNLYMTKEMFSFESMLRRKIYKFWWFFLKMTVILKKSYLQWMKGSSKNT